jgi:hypothetical protein
MEFLCLKWGSLVFLSVYVFVWKRQGNGKTKRN